MNLQIKNQFNTPVIQLFNFKKEDGESPIFISTQVKIELDHFTAASTVSIELSEYNELLSNFKKLYQTLNWTFFFQDIDSRLVLKFEPNQTGQIRIKGNLRNPESTTNLEFEFQSGQELLPELMDQCNLIMNYF